MSGVNNVVLNRFEELKRCVPAGKRIGRCHSEERGDEGLYFMAAKRKKSLT